MLIYLESLTGKLFKILPLRESESESLAVYLDSLWIEMSGAYLTFPKLEASADYISMLNIVGYLNTRRVSVAQCKREVFKLISTCEKLQSRFGGASDA